MAGTDLASVMAMDPLYTMVRDDTGVEHTATPEYFDAEGHAVTDEEAERFLRLAHQRLGHASLRFLRKMHEQGTLFGPDISIGQFESVQFFCALEHSI